MNARALIVLAWAIAAAATAMSLGAVLLIAMTLEQPFFAGFAFRGYDVSLALAMSWLGALIVSQRLRHPVGWLLLVAGFTSGLQTLADQYAVFAFARGTDSPVASLAAWLPQWIWITSVLAVTLALLLFPDGRLPSRRWRPFAGSITAAMLATAALWAVAPGETAESNVYPVPDLFGFGAPSALSSIGEALILVAPVGLLGGFIALAARMRRADVVEHQQIKWLMFAALVCGVTLALMLVAVLVRVDPVIRKILEIAGIAAFLLLPAAIAIAILRYRLYDIDLLINRTLVYGATSATLVLTYALVVLALGTALRPFTQASELAVAGSTLAAAALVQPVRRRIQTAVDRRFYRARYDAERTVDRFALRLRDEVDLDALRAELVGVVRDTVRPVRVSLWLRERAK
jgi:hypothetical protein